MSNETNKAPSVLAAFMERAKANRAARAQAPAPGARRGAKVSRDDSRALAGNVVDYIEGDGLLVNLGSRRALSSSRGIHAYSATLNGKAGVLVVFAGAELSNEHAMGLPAAAFLSENVAKTFPLPAALLKP